MQSSRDLNFVYSMCLLKLHQEGATVKIGTKDLSVYICHRKAFCQYDFQQHAFWKLIHKLTLPPIICYQ